jgi:hypothetical protein
LEAVRNEVVDSSAQKQLDHWPIPTCLQMIQRNTGQTSSDESGNPAVRHGFRSPCLI